jgi:DNA-binding beta-propeller fold protein YncE
MLRPPSTTVPSQNQSKKQERILTIKAVVLTFAVVLMSVWSISQRAAAETMIVGIDRKFAFDQAGKRQAFAPGNDEVVVFDLTDPASPKRVGSVPVENSVVGPPTNLAVTPNGQLALVANSVRSEKADTSSGWKSLPADELSVIDLVARPPKVISTLKVGAQPSGLAIDATGSLALVANREGRSISVLRIRCADVTLVDTVTMNDVVASVAIAPDGRHALAAKFAAHKVAILDIDAEGKVTYPGRDLTVGPWPYSVAISPDGRLALTSDTGNMATSDGNLDTVSVIDLAANPPRTVDHVTVGDSPEGLVVSPRGDVALVTVLQGSYDAPAGSWYRNPTGRLVSLAIKDGKVSVADTINVGAFPEGVAISGDGNFAYVGNFASNTISVIRIEKDGRLVDTGKDIVLTGPPASLRIGSQ